MNAQQLKNAILQEAIEGRLVPQDPNEESWGPRIMGSVLLITFEVFVLHIVLTPCALPSVQLFSNAKAKIRAYSRTSKFSTQKNDQ